MDFDKVKQQILRAKFEAQDSIVEAADDPVALKKRMRWMIHWATASQLLWVDKMRDKELRIAQLEEEVQALRKTLDTVVGYIDAH